MPASSTSTRCPSRNLPRTPADQCAAGMPTNPATMPPSANAEGGTFQPEDTMSTCKFCDMIERIHDERGTYVPKPVQHNCELFAILRAEFGATDYDDAAKILRSLKAKVDYLEGVTKRLAALVDRYKNP